MVERGRSAAHTQDLQHAADPTSSTRDSLVVIIASTPEERIRLAGALPVGATALLASDINQAGRVMAQLPDAAPVSPPMSALLPQPQLELRADRLSLALGGREVALTTLELDLLTYLLPRVGEVATFEQLSHVGWRTDYLGNGAHIHAAVGRLRTKLVGLGAPVKLQAVRGLGFRLARHDWDGSLQEAVGS